MEDEVIKEEIHTDDLLLKMIEEDQLKRLSMKDLKDILSKRNLKATGKKNDLLDLLSDHLFKQLK